MIHLLKFLNFLCQTISSSQSLGIGILGEDASAYRTLASKKHAELPGIDQDNIEIEIRGNSLALRGNRQFLGEGKLENYHRIERAYGTFERYFTLPDSIDITKITAKFKDGVLTLTIPKIEETLSRRIEIIVE